MSRVPSGVAEGDYVVACFLTIGSRHPDTTGRTVPESQSVEMVWFARTLFGGLGHWDAPALVRIGADGWAKETGASKQKPQASLARTRGP